MGHYSVAEAKNHRSDLINRSLAGESVVITRHGHPVVELKAGRRVTVEDMDWLAAHRVDINSIVDGGTLLSRMRDEEERESLPRCERSRCACDKGCLYVPG
jgi:prevent-host-death family protein